MIDGLEIVLESCFHSKKRPAKVKQVEDDEKCRGKSAAAASLSSRTYTNVSDPQKTFLAVMSNCHTRVLSPESSENYLTLPRRGGTNTNNKFQNSRGRKPVERPNAELSQEIRRRSISALFSFNRLLSMLWLRLS